LENLDLTVLDIPNSSGFAGAVPQVVQPRSSNHALGADFNLFDARAVEREDTLDALAEAHFAYSEGRTGTGAVSFDHKALKDLDSGLFTLHDAIVDAHGVAAAKTRVDGSELAIFKLVKKASALHDSSLGRSGATTWIERGPGLCTLRTGCQ
jgi:hypothetical protein